MYLGVPSLHEYDHVLVRRDRESVRERKRRNDRESGEKSRLLRRVKGLE